MPIAVATSATADRQRASSRPARRPLRLAYVKSMPYVTVVQGSQ